MCGVRTIDRMQTANPTLSERPEPKLVRRLIGAASISCVGLLALVDGVTDGWISSLDADLLLAFRAEGAPDDPIGPGWFEELVRDLTALGGLGLTAIALTVTWLADLVRRRPRAAWFHLVAVLLGVGLVFWLKDVYDRPRPSLVPHEALVLTHSFPSGHAATAALAHLSIGTAVARGCRTEGMARLAIGTAVVLALLVGISRVYLGVHWPSDVVAGWLIGASWAFGIWSIEGFLRRRGLVEPVRPARGLPDGVSVTVPS